MSPLQMAGVGFSLLVAIVGATLAIEARYEKVDMADSVHERLAQETETDRLDTRLELLKIRIDKFKDLAEVRPLTEAELIELRALEQERAAILNRLAAKG